MERYEIRVYHFGNEIARWENLTLERAGFFYRVYFYGEDYGVFLWKDGVRVPSATAWKLMEVGFGWQSRHRYKQRRYYAQQEGAEIDRERKAIFDRL